MAVDVRMPNLLRVHTDGAATVSAERPRRWARSSTPWSRSTPACRGQLVDESGGLHKFVNVYVDDEDIRYLDQLDTKVADGATISILPAVAGGS